MLKVSWFPVVLPEKIIPVNSTGKLLLVLLVLGLSPAAQSAAGTWVPGDGSQLTFTIHSGDKPAGTLVFNFSQVNGTLVETRTEHLELSRMLLKAVVDQTAEATWREQSLEAYTSRTTLKSTVKDSSASLKVSKQASEKFLATNQDGSHELPAGAWPLTLWNRDFTSHQALFDLTLGQPITVNSVSKGFENVTADGSTQSCERFDVTTSKNGNSSKVLVWYDTAGRLCAMTISSGLGTLDYVRTSAK
jgi:hypothetical protein